MNAIYFPSCYLFLSANWSENYHHYSLREIKINLLAPHYTGSEWKNHNLKPGISFYSYSLDL